MRALLTWTKQHPVLTVALTCVLLFAAQNWWITRKEKISQDRYEAKNQELIQKVQTFVATAQGERAKVDALQVELNQLAGQLAALRQNVTRASASYAKAKDKSIQTIPEPIVLDPGTVPGFDDLCKRADSLHIQCRP